jgi:hypothetical protein
MLWLKATFNSGAGIVERAGLPHSLKAAPQQSSWLSCLVRCVFSQLHPELYPDLVVFLGAYLWFFFLQLSAPSHLSGVSHLQHLWNQYPDPGPLLNLLTQTLMLIAIGMVAFGILLSRQRSDCLVGRHLR